MQDLYHMKITRSLANKSGPSGEILVDAVGISEVCAYNIIKLHGNCVELKRLEGNDGETV